MKELPPSLKALWRDRHAAWWKQHYEDAVARIEDHTDVPENPYYEAPEAYHSAHWGPLILDDVGGEMTPDDARRFAFDLLVLADLAPMTPEPSA